KNFKGELEVENRFHFTDLKQCTFQWELVNYKKPTDQFTGYTAQAKGTVNGPGIAPGKKGKLKLNLPKNWKEYEGLILAAYDPDKKQIYKWAWRLQPTEKVLENMVASAPTEVVEITE